MRFCIWTRIFRFHPGQRWAIITPAYFCRWQSSGTRGRTVWSNSDSLDLSETCNSVFRCSVKPQRQRLSPKPIHKSLLGKLLGISTGLHHGVISFGLCLNSLISTNLCKKPSSFSLKILLQSLKDLCIKSSIYNSLPPIIYATVTIERMSHFILNHKVSSHTGVCRSLSALMQLLIVLQLMS